MVSRAAFEELSDALEMALGNFKRAQEALDAAVVAHAACDALLAKQAETHCQLLLANNLYRQAVLAFLANDANPASARVLCMTGRVYSDSGHVLPAELPVRHNLSAQVRFAARRPGSIATSFFRRANRTRAGAPLPRPSICAVSSNDARPGERDGCDPQRRTAVPTCLALAEIFATFGVSSPAALATRLSPLSTFARTLVIFP